MRLEPGAYAWAALIVLALLVDVALVWRGFAPLSTIARRSPVARILISVLALHLVATVPYDPLTAAGRWLSARGLLGELAASDGRTLERAPTLSQVVGADLNPGGSDLSGNEDVDLNEAVVDDVLLAP